MRTSPARRRSSSSRILARAPVRLLAFQAHDHLLERLGQLVGIAHRPPRAVRERFDAVLLVAVVNLVAGLAGNPERAAHLRSCPRHPVGGPQIASVLPLPKSPSTASTHPARSVTHVSGTKRYLCLGSLKNTTRLSREAPRSDVMHPITLYFKVCAFLTPFPFHSPPVQFASFGCLPFSVGPVFSVPSGLRPDLVWTG